MGFDSQVMPTPLSNFETLKKSKAKLNTGRTQQEKDEKEEMLTFKNLKYDERKDIRFDVFLNAEANSNWNKLDRAKFAGSYTNFPHFHGDASKPPITTVQQFQQAIITSCLRKLA
ncbi:hypothetical protein FXO38_24297 [Capsicum annuum]|uniref:Polyphenol oxidase C-terminal domain-containing protein n=1 Tax=Capsicum annuum TaxID=4072 RepID=A0A2G3AGC0_CAPAN|nr:hypothetical protein FXO38_24297 [Capsicum annuum]KAF3656345.1 hypothetical protein FXO37_15525 [Capsicum annuum]PHT93285.1 hypothetical protein T459_01167 [Capsicum annuum]